MSQIYIKHIFKANIAQSKAYICLALKDIVKQVSKRKYKVGIRFGQLSISAKVEHT